jgi:acyl-ACP thioesterase
VYLRSDMQDRKNRTIWNEDFRVRTYEADAVGDLRPDALFDYLQETAANHAHDLGFSAARLAKQGLTWILSRLVVDISAMPTWGSTVTVRTWPSGTQGIFATRDFRVTGPDGRLLAVATSAWFLIDIKRRRPARLPSAVTDVALPGEPRALVDDFSRMPPIEPTSPKRSLTVGSSLVDMNQHVNHVRYAAWSMDSLDPAWLAAHRLRRIQLQFRAEAKAGDRLDLYREPAGGGGFSWRHAIRNKEGDLIAQAQSEWERRGG